MRIWTIDCLFTVLSHDGLCVPFGCVFAIFAGADIFAFGFYTRWEVPFASDVSLRPWVVDDVPWVVWVLMVYTAMYLFCIDNLMIYTEYPFFYTGQFPLDLRALLFDHTCEAHANASSASLLASSASCLAASSAILPAPFNLAASTISPWSFHPWTCAAEVEWAGEQITQPSLHSAFNYHIPRG